jgi:hypothetical protein
MTKQYQQDVDQEIRLHFDHSFLDNRGPVGRRDYQNSECVRLAGREPGVSWSLSGRHRDLTMTQLPGDKPDGAKLGDDELRQRLLANEELQFPPAHLGDFMLQ